MKKKVVVIGGGTGTYTVLRGLKKFPELDITAIVTMADDGGSNKVLRDEFGLLPTSGIRQCMVALSENEGILRQLFSYRYYQGVGISGMTFGNLFMAAVSDIIGSQREAIKETAKLLDVKGRVLPVSYESVSLLATYSDGTEVLGEHLIDLGKNGGSRIEKFRTIPHTKIDAEAKEAIEQADLIVLGPGDLYTNTMANLVVEGVVEAINKSYAKVAFVMNVMTKKGESTGYSASDYLEDLDKYLPLTRLTHVIVNTDKTIDEKIAKAYKKEGAEWVVNDLRSLKSPITNHQYTIIEEKLLAKGKVEREKGDKLARSMVRHDSDRLAKVLEELV